MAVSLTKGVGAAIESAIALCGAEGLAKITARDGMSFRRYFKDTGSHQVELTVYRDKWWTGDGGTVHAEVFCLVSEYQLALGGCNQSWLTPDYNRPLLHFQYGLSGGYKNFAIDIHPSFDFETLTAKLAEWLQTDALPWIARLERPDGVVEFLAEEKRFASLARFLKFLGRDAAARRAVLSYFDELPRNIEKVVSQFRAEGLLDDEDAKTLLFSSMQNNLTYRDDVDRWVAEFRSGRIA